jgi:hypothetical protein
MQNPSPASFKERRNFLATAAVLACSVTFVSRYRAGDDATAGHKSTPDPLTGEPIIEPVHNAAAPVDGTRPSQSNLALNLAYVGAEYYSYAVGGGGLADRPAFGVGTQGGVAGARRVRFSDPVIASAAAELANDKLTQVAAFQSQLGSAAAARPAINLSSGFSGAFALAAERAGLPASFDPYSDDTQFLIGAFMIENRVAAAYRALLAETTDESSAAPLRAALGGAIYHDGLIRTLLAEQAVADPTITKTMANIGAMLDRLDGTDVGDHSLAGSGDAGTNIPDGDGQPMAFTRDPSQILKTLYLSPAGVGGYLPAGANGLPS